MFRAKIKGGKLSLGATQRAVFTDYLATNEGRTLIITPEKKGRSQSQNAYYWVYLGVIAQETGENADDLHEFFKQKLLPPVLVTVRGEEIRRTPSTGSLSKVEFGEYLDKIAALTEIPLPDPEAAGYISNYDKPYGKQTKISDSAATAESS
jgi:hypothetical protein